MLLCAFQLFNVHLLLLSGIGTPYDPSTGQGRDRPQLLLPGDVERQRVLRRQESSTRSSPPARSACASTSSTATISITAGSASSAAAIWARCRPTAGRSSARSCRKARRSGAPAGRRRSPTIISAAYQPATHGSCYSYRDGYLDLDPTYTDRLGRKLLRITFDFHANELKMSQYLTDRLAEIVAEDGSAADRQEAAHRALRRSPITRPRIPAAARSWAPIRRPAPSTAICKAGTCRTCSSPAPRYFRRTPATTRPARSARWPTGPPMRMRNQYLKNPGPLVQA